MTFDEMKRLLISARPSGDCWQECIEAIDTPDIHVIVDDPVAGPAHDMRATWRIRRGTTKAAGTRTCGFDELVDALEKSDPMRPILLFAFGARGCHYSVFVDASTQEFVACLRVGPRDPSKPK